MESGTADDSSVLFPPNSPPSNNASIPQSDSHNINLDFLDQLGSQNQNFQPSSDPFGNFESVGGPTLTNNSGQIEMANNMQEGVIEEKKINTTNEQSQVMVFEEERAQLED